MSCKSCKDISYSEPLTYHDLLMMENVDFYYEEINPNSKDDPDKDPTDDLRLVIECMDCGEEKRPNDKK